MGKRAQAKVKKRPRRDVEIIRTPKNAPRGKEVFRRPETSGMWDDLSGVKVSGKAECLEAFVRIVGEVESGRYKFVEGTVEKGSYSVVNEAERNGSSFVHVVPREAHKIFERMRREMPNSFLGFSMLCGKNGKKDLRVSCFAVPTSEITRAMISGSR